MAVLLTLIGLFYTEENWRGKRAWENCKRALEAQGVKLDWAYYIPAPVPENENFFGVPEMQKWFNGRGPTELSEKLAYSGFNVYSYNNRMVVADVTIGLPGTPMPDGLNALRWGDPASRAAAARLLTNALGPTTIAPQSPYPYSLAGFVCCGGPEEIQFSANFPAMPKTAPTEKELQQFLPNKALLAKADQTNALLKFEPDGNGSYHVTMPALVVAADYLAWSEQLAPQFALIRQALQRPYARMNGNYDEPVYLPIPNFVTERILSAKRWRRGRNVIF